MADLQRCGFAIIDGPFPGEDTNDVVRAYDDSFARAGDAQLRQGSTSLRLNGIAARKPLVDLYIHPQLVSAASALIGGPIRLSSFHARTLLPRVAAERLHQDVAASTDGLQLVGFILMVDAFRVDNGATRFIPGSQGMAEAPANIPEHHACGPAGSIIIFDATIWHGHGANQSDIQRRSLQGYFIRRQDPPATSWSGELSVEQINGLPAEARILLGV